MDADVTRRSTLSIRLYLRDFCLQFLDNCYNSLMRAVKVRCSAHHRISFHLSSAVAAVDSSQCTASSQAYCRDCSPPPDIVNGYMLTMWFMVCCWPYTQRSDEARSICVGWKDIGLDLSGSGLAETTNTWKPHLHYKLIDLVFKCNIFLVVTFDLGSSCAVNALH